MLDQAPAYDPSLALTIQRSFEIVQTLRVSVLTYHNAAAADAVMASWAAPVHTRYLGAQNLLGYLDSMNCHVSRNSCRPRAHPMHFGYTTVSMHATAPFYTPRRATAFSWEADEEEALSWRSFLSLPHMALLVVTGLPCSGRSTRVKEIQSYFESRLESNPSLSRVCVIQDADVHVDRHVYECMLTAPLHDSSTHGGTRARRLS